VPPPDPNATQEISVADLLASHPPPLPRPPRVPELDAESAPETEPEPEPATPRIEHVTDLETHVASPMTRARAKLVAARVAIVTVALFVSYAARAFWSFVVASLPHAKPRLRAEWERARRR
jgi:hypothetical protein